MKKAIQLFFLIATAALVFSAGKEASARVICSSATTSANSGNCYTRTTNPPTNDIWAVGGYLQGGVPKTFSEVALDYTGSLLPTSTLGTQNLGSAADPWANVYAKSETITNQLVTGQNSLSLQTTTQISVLVPVQVGALVLAEESVAGTLVTNTYNLCASTDTKAGDFVYISVSTSVPAVLGAKCSN